MIQSHEKDFGRAIPETLQHQETTRCIGLPPTGSSNHHPNENRPYCALPINLGKSDRDPATFTKALNFATNFARGMSEAGELYEIEIVAFNAGLHLLREDTSPVMDRISTISESIPEVTFSACGNTIKGMKKKEGAAPPVTELAQVVPAGVVRLMELDGEGYFIIRP